ncbi:delta-lactam-biosynthetic de-N-acetylase [Peptococcaceae bacterium 1198_IL3148]
MKKPIILLVGAFSLGILAFANQSLLQDNSVPQVESNVIAQQATNDNVEPPAKQNKPVNEAVKEPVAEKEIKTDKNAEPKEQTPPVQPDTDQSYAQYDNTKHGWGFTRNDQHQPPSVGWVGPVVTKYNGFYLGNTNEKTIYLTFDEGYENGYTKQILDVLKANGVKAHFFITAAYLKDQPELVKRMIAEGHIVGNHSVNHPSLPEVSTEQVKQEIQGLESQLNELINYDMYLFRPPRGEWSERTLKITEDLGYKSVFWSMAYQDWLVDQQKGWQYAHNHVMSNIHNGAVILLHAVSSDNANALDQIIKDLKSAGYTFGVIGR